jgi:hypothetical protein
MTNTVSAMFQTQYILDFSSASHSGTLGFAKHWYFQSKDVASVLHFFGLSFNINDFWNFHVYYINRNFILPLYSIETGWRTQDKTCLWIFTCIPVKGLTREVPCLLGWQGGGKKLAGLLSLCPTEERLPVLTLYDCRCRLDTSSYSLFKTWSVLSLTITLTPWINYI